MYDKNPIRRFLLRKNWWRRVKMRLNNLYRLNTKNPFSDLRRIFPESQQPLVIDGGANIGYVTFRMLKTFPRATVYAFEPNPQVFQVLKNAYSSENNVTAINAALGDKDESLLFYVSKMTGSSSFLTSTKPRSGDPIVGELMCDVRRLDTFLEERKLHRIDILKLDVEGFELAALRGCGAFLEEQRISAILTEVNIVRSREGQPLFHELTDFLESRGYHLFNLYGFVVQETQNRQALIGDAIYVCDQLYNRGALT